MKATKHSYNGEEGSLLKKISHTSNSLQKLYMGQCNQENASRYDFIELMHAVKTSRMHIRHATYTLAMYVGIKSSTSDQPARNRTADL